MPGDVGPSRLCRNRLGLGTYAAPSFTIWSFCFLRLPTNSNALAQQVAVARLWGVGVVVAVWALALGAGPNKENASQICFNDFSPKRRRVAAGNQALPCLLRHREFSPSRIPAVKPPSTSQ